MRTIAIISSRNSLYAFRRDNSSRNQYSLHNLPSGKPQPKVIYHWSVIYATHDYHGEMAPELLSHL